VTGLLRLFFYAKGVGFYLPNPFFVAKMLLYIAHRDALDHADDVLHPLAPRLAESGELPPTLEIATARRLIHVRSRCSP